MNASHLCLLVLLVRGLLIVGNIDLANRPIHANSDGSISTVRSLSIGTDEGEVLIPTVAPNGALLSDEEAIELYLRTRQHLGVFADVESATEYAETLHLQQAELYLGK
jgi:hypothetical protein